jgi:glycosyltransferase involved in cell wall biosynthesis
MELARSLAKVAPLDFVKWDHLDGQLRLMDSHDLTELFGADRPRTHPKAHRVATRFGDLFQGPAKPWLIFPEIPFHLEQGNEIFGRVVSQCRRYGVRTATIFYDLIPLREAAYGAGRDAHQRYVAEIVRSDLIIPISRFAGNDLIDYLQQELFLPPDELQHVRAVVQPVPLGEARVAELPPRRSVSDGATGLRMVMVGTVEPRKQQTRLLEVLNRGRSQHPELSGLQVDLFGSLHPYSSDALWAAIRDNPNIRYHNYASEGDIAAAYANATFSAFPSCNEGFGLPIVESLRHGVPCLTANFGAMAEVAAGGGCVTVDVRRDEEILSGLLRMCTDAALLERLRGEIAVRRTFTWDDYANEVLARLRRADAAEAVDAERFRETVSAWINARGGEVRTSKGGTKWRLVTEPGAKENASAPLEPGERLILSLPDLRTGPMHPLIDPAILPATAAAEVALVGSPEIADRIVAAAATSDLGLPLAPMIDTSSIADPADELDRHARMAADAQRIALVERVYERASRGAPVTGDRVPELAIVVSTYNRGPFVELNVEWLLQQIDAGDLPVRCVIVDNASTDDTCARLGRFASHPKFEYRCNSANTGMLGNLRECTVPITARYIWLTGDDDFVAVGALERTLSAIRRNPGVPMLFHNFGVYHRQSLSPTDNPRRFFEELIPLCPAPSPTGVYTVAEAAGEHDNLFTAIYPIVFRGDLASACFNHRFDGVPFGSLTECVPTTEFILGSLAACRSVWFSEVGIVGNAHNSWSAHRPRWHLVLMPEVFKLARAAGVDRSKIWKWSRIHKSLFDEAAGIAIASGARANLRFPEDFRDASLFFREQVELPQGLKLGKPSLLYGGV